MKSPSISVKGKKKQASASASGGGGGGSSSVAKPFKTDVRSSWERLGDATQKELKKITSTPRCTLDKAFGISKTRSHLQIEGASNEVRNDFPAADQEGQVRGFEPYKHSSALTPFLLPVTVHIS